ncbi:GNAT family N-acetyltransferase [Cytobacillus gottheilii]|uniref:GNAT family N-acetyltransferase n=1 Tax=Cytobacillus gottheilii TaxID=859144 RepID=A0ABX8FGH9_9BACI|nr:GNAT family N-acetyltransferase [Cytobacillus gottheilii]QVY63139.1 GNAT family N-acetyltransferase [Cytobacillus gottheilii]
MENGNLSWRMLGKSDYPFFESLISQSSKWKEIELGDRTLETFLKDHEYAGGEWRVWELGGTPISVSHHTQSSPSNKKPWLGTLLVHSGFRRKGFGERILDKLSDEMKDKGHKAIYAGVPIMENEWISFLSECGYEQFKLEKDKQDVQYLIFVKPTMM